VREGSNADAGGTRRNAALGEVFACRRHCAAKWRDRRLRYVADLWQLLDKPLLALTTYGVPNVNHNSGSRS
jgi:hypothetical protein